MPINIDHCRQHLKESDLGQVFIDELGWDRYSSNPIISVDEHDYTLNAIAQKRGMVVLVHIGKIPDYPTRRKIEREITKVAHEHLIVFIDSKKTTQIWQWVKRETGKPTACREHTYNCEQPGDALIQKLQTVVFSLEEEESLTITQVTGRVRAAFDVERITKRFYDRFKDEHTAFLKFIKGIPDEELQRWYVSVMLNRLMFVYFIQKKGFLNGDTNYLQNRLTESKKRYQDSFYREFLCPLFFEGFARESQERSAAINKMLGKVPYLNGGIFQKHQIEELHGKQIQVSDRAFEMLFEFFEQYQWHLDERPLRADNEINPDVLGYIFEKYINQKQMGAYYTKEDITGYISKSTIIPYLFETAKQKCKIAFEGEKTVWELLKIDPERYIYESVKKGAALSLPSEVATGLDDVAKRSEWNKPAPVEYALPTETWREVVSRRKRYEETMSNLVNGEIHDINDLITYNLDIRQFAQDVIENREGPELLRAFWHAIENITVLDPTCGSGAFLFAALNILEQLYEACLDRMEAFIEDLERSNQKHRPEKFSDFRKILKRVTQHPNRRYFIFKSIIINNLYGVDIMEEAVEICKLRLFLKLIAQVDYEEQIEPLPDIDFNIRAGNTLVGYATYDEVKKAVTSSLDFDNALARIEGKAQDIDRLFVLFRQQQTEFDGEVTPDDKKILRERLKSLENELNIYLAKEYGVDIKTRTIYEKWIASHKPFHWFIEFYGIFKKGGFDVIIGNPPYVEYAAIRGIYKVKNYETMESSNLYTYVIERAISLQNSSSYNGMIIPISAYCTDRMEPFQAFEVKNSSVLYLSNYAERPSKLFEGAERNLTIALLQKKKERLNEAIFTTSYYKWNASFRELLFDNISYIDAKETIIPGIIPKIGSTEEIGLISKLRKIKKNVGFYTSRIKTKNMLYYRNSGGRYWKIITDFQPKFYLNGAKDVSSRESYLYFNDEESLKITVCILNSSLYYWYYVMHSDARTNNPSDLKNFPLDIDELSTKKKEKLLKICVKLMTDIESNSISQPAKYRTGDVKFQQFFPQKSKPIIDEIDVLLAQHYGFTADELDFIINYDIKYRMGTENETDAEE